MDQAVRQAALAAFAPRLSELVDHARDRLTDRAALAAALKKMGGLAYGAGLPEIQCTCLAAEQLVVQQEGQEAVVARMFSAIQRHMDAVAAGFSGLPTELAACMVSLAQANGTAATLPELFVPFRVPHPLGGWTPRADLTDAEFFASLRAQAIAYREAMTAWASAPGAPEAIDALNAMRVCLATLEQRNRYDELRQFFDLATAVLDLMAKGQALPRNVAPQHLLVQIEQMLARAARHPMGARTSEDLLPAEGVISLLFYVIANADAEGARVRRLHRDFGLQAHLRAFEAALTVDHMTERLTKALQALADEWVVACTSGEREVFRKAAAALLDKRSALPVAVVPRVIEAVLAAVPATKGAVGERLALDVATALAFCSEMTLGVDAETEGQADLVIARLQGADVRLRVSSRGQAVAMGALGEAFRKATEDIEAALDVLLRSQAGDGDNIHAARQTVAGRLTQFSGILSIVGAPVFSDFCWRVVEELLPADAASGLRRERHEHQERLIAAVGILSLAAGFMGMNRHEQYVADHLEKVFPREAGAAGGNAYLDLPKDDDLLEIYLEEAGDIITRLPGLLRQVVDTMPTGGPVHDDVMADVRRAFHTLKGSGRMVLQAATNEDFSNLGEAAWHVERVMNAWNASGGQKATPALVAFLEYMGAEFAGWRQRLAQHKMVTCNWVPVEARANTLIEELQRQSEPPAAPAAIPVAPDASLDFRALATQPVGLPVEDAPPEDANVVIGAVTVPGWLYEIYQRESGALLTVLADTVLPQLAEGQLVPPDLMRLCHTLGSSSNTAGFHDIHALARALEKWAEQRRAGGHALVGAEVGIVRAALMALAESVTAARAGTPPAPHATHREAVLQLVEEHQQQRQREASASAAMCDIPIAPEVAEDASCTPVTGGVPKFSESLPQALPPSSLDTPSPSASLALEAADSILDLPDVIETPIPGLAWRQHMLTISNEIDDEIDDGILEIFTEEAHNALENLVEQTKRWEAGDDEAFLIIARELHTMKGGARMAGAKRLGAAIHHLEDLVIAAGAHRGSLHAADFAGAMEVVANALDNSGILVESAGETRQHPDGAEPGGKEKERMLRVPASRIQTILRGTNQIAILEGRMGAALAVSRRSMSDLVSSLTTLRTLMRETETEADLRIEASGLRMKQVNGEEFDPLEFDRYTRLQELTRMLSENIQDINGIQGDLKTVIDEIDEIEDQRHAINDEIQHGATLSMIAGMSMMLGRMNRVVKQSATELGKNVAIKLASDTEFNVTLLERLMGPIEHLLRNAVAHGIEMPAERVMCGKGAQGTITIAAAERGGEIRLTIADDGAGIDIEQVRQKAIEKGVIDAETAAALMPEEVERLILMPGFSTVDVGATSQLAGRGVGMDVVASAFAEMGGEFVIRNFPGHGIEFVATFPADISTATVVPIGFGNGGECLVPASLVTYLHLMDWNEAQHLADTTGRCKIDGTTHQLFRMSDLLEVPRAAGSRRISAILMVVKGESPTAILIDGYANSERVLVRPVARILSSIPGIIGVNVSGEGRSRLILNPYAMARAAMARAGFTSRANLSSLSSPRASGLDLMSNRSTVLLERGTGAAGRRSRQSLGSMSAGGQGLSDMVKKVVRSSTLVMVVDDSTTVRAVTSKFLKSKGFLVETGRDGRDALDKLNHMDPPDIFLLDIEMPNMDGFAFARTIKLQPQWRDIPIIMISSRSRDTYKEIAREIGINWFFSKPYKEDEVNEKIRELVTARQIAPNEPGAIAN